MLVRFPSNARAFIAAICSCTLITLPARASDTYSTLVIEGLSALRAGEPVRAVESFRKAVRYDANDPAVWLGWGTALLQTRNIAPARNCFARASMLQGTGGYGRTGLGLCDVLEDNTASALKHFAATPDSQISASLKAYFAALTGGPAHPEGTTALHRAVSAYVAAREGKADEALAAWRAVLDRPNALQPPHWPMTASFDVLKPISLRWSRNPSLQRPPAVSAGTVQGRITLRAAELSDTTQAVYEIDGMMAGMTNVPPYSFQWNTSEWPDGRHLVRTTTVRARRSRVVTEKWYVTGNGGATPRHPHDNIERINGLLDAVLAVRPDERLAHYEIAKSLLSAGDVDEAREHLEDIVADDPGWKDAGVKLSALPTRSVGAVIWNGDKSTKRIALTFDDGPNPRHTPGLLNVLKRVQAPATFFVVGKQAVQHQDWIARMARDGHQVENHTWNHVNLRNKSEAEALKELAATKRLIARLTGRPTRYYRPPGGNWSAAALKAARSLDMQAVMWSFASGKSEGLPVDDMTPVFIRAAKPGSIYLIHNGTDKMEELVEKIVPALRAHGYEFVRLDELMKARD